MARDWILASEEVAIPLDKGDQVSAVSLKPQEGKFNVAEDKLILRLLAGFHEDAKGRPIVSYLEPGSVEELEARAALARQLRDNTLGNLARELLALAIAPNIPSARRDMRPTLEIVFKNKARGNKSAWARNRLVISFIKGWIREKRKEGKGRRVKEEAAKQAAQAHFGLSRSQVAEIWRRDKKQDEERALTLNKKLRAKHQAARRRRKKSGK
jgi:hypothetical protein